jgi:hypothetical protein
LNDAQHLGVNLFFPRRREGKGKLSFSDDDDAFA